MALCLETKEMAGVNELSHSLIQKQRCQLNAANLDAGFLLMLYRKFQAPAHSCDCHSGTSRQHPQDGKSLPERISMGLHCAGSLKFSLLEPNGTSEVKHRSPVLPGGQMAQTQAG